MSKPSHTTPQNNTTKQMIGQDGTLEYKSRQKHAAGCLSGPQRLSMSVFPGSDVIRDLNTNFTTWANAKVSPIYIYMQISTYVYMRVCARVCMCIQVFYDVCAYMYICMYIWPYPYLFVRCVCIYTNIF